MNKLTEEIVDVSSADLTELQTKIKRILPSLNKELHIQDNQIICKDLKDECGIFGELVKDVSIISWKAHALENGETSFGSLDLFYEFVGGRNGVQIARVWLSPEGKWIVKDNNGEIVE